jgi:hypothetical protein
MKLSELIDKLKQLQVPGEDKEIVAHSPEGFVDIISVWADEEAPAHVMEIEWMADLTSDTMFKENLQEI